MGNISRVILKHKKLKVIKYTQDESGFSVLVRDLNLSLDIWVDIWKCDGEVMSAWNQYIFDMLSEDDLKRKDYQDSANHFMDMTSCAINYLENLGVL